MNFLKRLIRAYREAQTTVQYDFLADTEDGWQDGDSEYLAAVFASPMGHRLRVRLTNYVVRCAVEATRQTSNQSYHCGLARGAALTVTAIEEHFARLPRSEGTPENQPSAIGVAEFGIN